jgi:hypothetical protein
MNQHGGAGSVLQQQRVRPGAQAETGGVEGASDDKRGSGRVKHGSDTPWMHALEQGNGNKTGIRRRFAEEIAAQQAAAGVGSSDDPAPTDGTVPADGTVPVDGGTAPVADDGTAPVVDVPTTPIDETVPAPVEPETQPVGTIVIDGAGLDLGSTQPVDADAGLLELLEVADEAAATEPTVTAEEPVTVDGSLGTIVDPEA